MNEYRSSTSISSADDRRVSAYIPGMEFGFHTAVCFACMHEMHE